LLVSATLEEVVINLERESIIYFLATHAMELVKPRHSKAAAETIVEDRIPYLNSYDVLIQYLNTLAVSDGFFS
jgi:ATP-dependent Lhr-like helicase